MRHPWQPALLLAFLALLVGGLPAFAQQEFPEAAALLQFRASFSNGEAVLPSWASAEQDPCTSWAEVQCSSATGTPRVIRLSLAGYMLEGEVEEGAWNLTTLDQLQSLDLSNNLIAGSLTSSVFSALPPSLLELQLGDNLLEGTLPPSLALPPRLSRLGLDGNQLAGTIPQVWALPETITFLGLSNNLLAGALPRSWALPSLLRMQLHNNSLAGRVSEWEAPQQAQVTIFPTTSQGFCGEVPPSPQYIALEGDREVLIFSLPECTLLPPVMDWPILDPGCSQVVELGENDTQAALAYSYGQDWAFFARLNGGLGANDTLDPGSNLCVFPAQLPEGGGFSCPPEPAWPPAMITDTNATDLAARLEEFCPQISPLPDNFAAAVMCCSGERSEALASALEHNFRAGCTSPCVFNPTFEEGAVEGEDGSFPAWFWDEPNGCWVVDNPENPACLPSHSPALQSSRDTLAAAEAQPILLDLLLPRCAARLPGGVAEELQAAQSEPMPAGSALLEALASPCAADALQAAPLGSEARLLQQKFSPGRAAECDLANTLSLNTSSCICNPAIPYLHCHAAMVQDLQALVEEAADAEDGSRRRNHRRLLSRPDSIPLGEWVGEGRSAEELLGVFSAGGGGGGWEAEETCVAGGMQGVGLEFCFTPQVDLEDPPETRWDLLDEFVVRQSQEPWPACGMPPDLFDSPDPISQTSADAYLSQTLTLPSAACLDLPPPLAQLAADIAAAAGLATDDRGRVCGLAGDTVLLPNLGSLWLSMAAVPQQPLPTTLRLLSELWAQWTFDQAPACVAATKSPVLNSRLGCTLQCRLGPQPEPWDAALGVGIGSPLFYWSPLPGVVLYATSPEALPDCLAAANPGGECVSPAPAPPPAPPSPAPVGNVPPPPAVVVPTPPTAPPVVLPPPPPTPPVAVPSPPPSPPVVVPTPPTTPPVVVPPPQSPPPPRPPVLPPLDPPAFPPPAPSPPPSSPEYNQSPPQASPPPPSPRPSPQPRHPPPSPSPALPPPPPPKPSPSPSPSRSPSPSPSTAPAPAPGSIPAAPPSPAPEPSPALPPQMPSPSPEEQSPSPAQPSPSPQDPPAPAADPPAAVQPSPSPQGSNPSPAGSAPGPAVK